MMTKWTLTPVFLTLLMGMSVGCAPGEAPEPEYTYIYSEPPAPEIVANTLDLAGSPSMGPLDAKVTIIESSDFQCPFCGRVVPTMKQLLEQYPNDVRVVFKHNPLSFHKRAMPAAKAAMAAHAQGKFWEYHDKLFEVKKFGDADLERYAQELNLDMEQFRAVWNDPKTEEKVLHDQKAMVSAGAGGTPAFFVNGKLVSGAKPLSAFQSEVNSAIAEADALLKSGTAKADLHHALLSKKVSAAFADAVIHGKPVVGGPPPRKKKREEKPEDTKPVDIDIDPTDPVLGKKDAKVTIVIFSDFECPFCGKLVPTMDQIKKEYGEDVRFVFKQHPLSFHKKARLAAAASLAANEQGKFWEYHDLLFENRKAMDRADLIRYAEQLGLDVAVFEKSMDAPDKEASIKEDMLAAQKIGVRGTPHSFVNGRRIKGARPFASFKAFIDDELGIKKKSNEAVKPPLVPRDPSALLGPVQKGISPVKPVILSPGTAAAEVILFADVQDKFTGMVLEELLGVLKASKYPGRLVLGHAPKKFHGNSMDRAVGLQGVRNASPVKLRRFVQSLLKDERVLKGPALEKLAVEAGIKRGLLSAALKDENAKNEVKAAKAQAEDFGVVASPTLYIGGRRFMATAGFGREALGKAIELAGKESK